MSRIACVLLAAGRGSRFGTSPKLLADLGGRPVVDWAADAMTEGVIAPRAVVVRPGDEGIRTLVGPRGFAIVENPKADEGMGTSIAAGAAWAAMQDVDGVMICLGDTPFVSPVHLHRLAALFALGAGAIVASLPAGARASQVGPPAVFPRACFDDLVALEGDRGAKSLFETRSVASVACFAGELLDVDTPEALFAARAWLRRVD